MTMGRRFSNIAASSLIALFAACASPGGPPLHRIAAEINATLRPVRKGLGPGDQLEVIFAPGELGDWTHLAQVRPDGRAAFLALEELDVVGLTPEELTEILTRAYDRTLVNPRLTVNVTQWAPRTFSVLGEVRSVGAYPVDPHTRLPFTEALALAGGPQRGSAYLANTILVRWDLDTQRQRAWTIDARPRFWSAPETIYLQAFDTLYVPNTPVDKIANWIEANLRVLIPIPRVFVPTV